MRISNLLLAFALPLVLFSCAKEPVPAPTPDSGKPSVERRKLTLTATLPGLTKSMLQDGSKVLWTPGDKISVFCGSAQAEFTSTNTDPAATATFEGYIEVPSDMTDAELTLYGVYPYSASNSINDGVVMVSLPAEQRAVAGTFADDLSISVGRATGSSMTFWNVCGLVEVSVTREDVKSVSISGLSGEALAGTLSVSVAADGKPAVTSVADAGTSVKISATEGEYLASGQNYYLVVAPVQLAQGAKIAVETDEALMIKKIEKPLEVKRSVISVLSGVDDGALPEFVPFADAAFKAYCVDNFDTDGDGEISLSEAAAVTRIDCSNKGISSLGGIKYFTQLEELICNNNQLTAIDISGNPALASLDCRDNQLVYVETAANAALKSLIIAGNELDHLDVSMNASLEYLDVTCCQLVSLDVTHNPELSTLHAYGNQLTELDVTQNAKLISLGCEINRLTSLDLSQNPELVSFSCFNNELTSIDLSGNPNLECLMVDNNKLTSLDVSSNPKLTVIHAFINQLSEFNCSQNPALVELMCGQNKLSSLDLSACSSIKNLDCPDNPMEYIYVPFGQSFEVLNIPEGSRLVQKASSATEDFTREVW
ncbi:MAG: hypothetical protein IJ653_02245 [Bacteroidales bacterium]|nr:hypothetical protein [Bacteroidales bacterium]